MIMNDKTKNPKQLDIPSGNAENTNAVSDTKEKIGPEVKAEPVSGEKVKPVSKSLVVDPLEGFTLVIDEAKALKLSPKTTNHVLYQLAVKDEDKTLHLRMTGNEGGGLHSKEWIPLNAIFDLIEPLGIEPISSTYLKPLFAKGSANNAGFLAAVLRSKELSLLVKSVKSQFQHERPSYFDQSKSNLLALAK